MTERQADALLRSDIRKLCAMFRGFGRDSLLLAALAYNVGCGNVMKSRIQVYVYLPEGTLALRECTKVHIDVLPLGVLLVRQFLEVDKEISLHFLLVEEVVTLVDDSLEATAAYRLGSCRKVEVVLLFRLVLRLGIDVDAKRLMADDFHRALITIAWIIVKIIGQHVSVLDFACTQCYGLANVAHNLYVLLMIIRGEVSLHGCKITE